MSTIAIGRFTRIEFGLPWVNAIEIFHYTGDCGLEKPQLPRITR